MEPIDNSKYILLYKGQGAEEFCVKKTEKSFQNYLGDRSISLISIDASYFTTANLKNAQSVVIPGGNAFKMGMDFRGEGIERIRNFVLAGGSYIGFCAGAYFAGPYSYNCGEIINPANLISCKLDGPAIDLGVDANLLNKMTARSVLVNNEKNEKFYSFWNGGGYYPWFNPGDQLSIAQYQNKPFGEAVICSFEKKGTVVVSNIHPEMQLNETELDIYPNINKQNLLSSCLQQKALFSRICDLAGLGTEKAKLFCY